ncbi:D-alanyl-D-alanine carboxypeptidase [Leucobacter coleopterorum]|uniref:D-alanyl-D-alanine carboxypeptidase n=1 Tax=Leucobacter coleopterorum TaxID=2714933 RepID=A0ABX6JYA3_9MICO|nr:D-alanyl-D-alanine carboxypeptidase [Leucobacter coleopterorum]QIM17750.1 D-alanyl-D-alanine carboxypeptidase [Leucobacter coleopterorum]
MTLPDSSATAPLSSSAPSPAKHKGLRATLVLLSVLVLLVAGYTVAVASVPLPSPEVTLEMSANESFGPEATEAQAVVDAQTLPTAVGWADQKEVWSNDPQAYPLASISKLITVLVCQEKEPLEPGADGPIHVWNEADAARQQGYLADDGVAYPIPVGTEVSLRQMLTLIFLPSANDYAAAYAYSVFGDNDTFVAAVNDWKQRHGFDSVNLVEPTGMDEANVASVADILQIGRLALQNPTIAEFTRMPSADMPWGIGTIENTNPLLTELPGILGVKTGRSSSAGFNYLVAQEGEAFGRPLVKIAVTFGRASKEDRAQSGRDMLAAIEALPQQIEVVKKDSRVGVATTVDGTEIPLVAADSAKAVLLPGEAASRSIEVGEFGAEKAGAHVGSIEIKTPTGDDQVKILTTVDLVQPDFWWRFTHPAAVFG